VGKAGYKASTEGAVALVASATKSVLGVLAPAQFGCDLKKFRVSMDQTTAMLGVDCEICACTFATNPPGTNSTTVTVTQTYGRAITAGFTAAKNWTAEPTVITVLDEFYVDPDKGAVLYDYPLGDTPDNDVSKGFCIRAVTQATTTPNLRASFWFERC
jgi:hypothetical protein